MLTQLRAALEVAGIVLAVDKDGGGGHFDGLALVGAGGQFPVKQIFVLQDLGIGQGVLEAAALLDGTDSWFFSW